MYGCEHEGIICHKSQESEESISHLNGQTHIHSQTTSVVDVSSNFAHPEWNDFALRPRLPSSVQTHKWNNCSSAEQ